MHGAYPVPPPPQKSNTLLIVFLIIGGVILVVVLGIVVMGALAVTGTRKYINASKAAEATNTIGQISRDAAAAYEAESIDPSGTTGITTVHKLCASASHPVPSTMADVRGKKYMSSPSDWSADSTKNGGFYCLKFDMSMPQYYQYDYKITGSGSKLGDSFTAQAKGDLDGDMEESTFEITGTIGSGDMVTLGEMKQTNPDE
jgi:type IV pilus assembly protein PilA